MGVAVGIIGGLVVFAILQIVEASNKLDRIIKLLEFSKEERK